MQRDPAQIANNGKGDSDMTDWLTLMEAAAYLKVNPRTLCRWARQGKVPAHRLSGTRRYVWRFLQRELDAMLRTPSGAEKGSYETSTAV
jgi:excisionase family DNA binding protein